MTRPDVGSAGGRRPGRTPERASPNPASPEAPPASGERVHASPDVEQASGERAPASPEAARLRLAAEGPLSGLSPELERRLLQRGRGSDPEVARSVAELIAEVRSGGEAALRAQLRRFDGVEPAALEVPRTQWESALERLDPAVRAALERAAANIAAFHRAQLRPPLVVETEKGVVLGRRSDPLRRVGAYVPGGRAAYPSTVLMCVVPARVAGVDEVVVCSPPGRDGLPAPAVLAACALAGADRVFALGGAGAVAALALGSGGVPAVDRIVGPGNAYVAEAKRQLTGSVAIDSPAGPSEVLILADASADPVLVAAELIAQAEHDPDAAAVLVSSDPDLAGRVRLELSARLPAEPREDVIRAALATAGALLLASGLEEALAFAERYAPEHLLLLLDDPRAALSQVRAAGTVFLGAPSSVAFGDYLTGANHTLPTGSLARGYSGLSVDDFLRWTTWQEVSASAAAELAGPTAVLAEAEGLPGHARAAALRGNGGRVAFPATRSWTDPGTSPRTTPGARPGARGESPTTPGPGMVPAVLRSAYRAVELYDPARQPTPVDLSDNTNLFGPCPAAAKTLARAPRDALTRYPSVYADRLKAQVAARHGVDPGNVATGCGSDDLLDSVFRAFGEPGDAVAYPDPTFGMVPIFGRMNALRPLPVPPRVGTDPDVEALIATRARLTYLCRPNNPTGSSLPRNLVERLEAALLGLLVLDEAYADFAGDDMTRWAAMSRRTLSVRTFSKAFGLAGLRVGYAVGPAALIREVEKSRGPYKVSGPAEAAALAALREDGAWADGIVARVGENRERLAEALGRRGLVPLPGRANFLLVPLPEDLRPEGARQVAERLRGRGVAVRPFPDVPGVGDALRVTVGPWEQMETFLMALDAVRRAGRAGVRG